MCGRKGRAEVPSDRIKLSTLKCIASSCEFSVMSSVQLEAKAILPRVLLSRVLHDPGGEDIIHR